MIAIKYQMFLLCIKEALLTLPLVQHFRQARGSAQREPHLDYAPSKARWEPPRTESADGLAGGAPVATTL